MSDRDPMSLIEQYILTAPRADLYAFIPRKGCYFVGIDTCGIYNKSRSYGFSGR